MRGVANDPVFRAKLMAMHEEGVSLTALSTEFGIARPVLSRWWSRYTVDDIAGLVPRSRRPHDSPTQTPSAMVRRVLKLRAQRRSAVWIARELPSRRAFRLVPQPRTTASQPRRHDAS